MTDRGIFQAGAVKAAFHSFNEDGSQKPDRKVAILGIPSELVNELRSHTDTVEPAAVKLVDRLWDEVEMTPGEIAAFFLCGMVNIPRLATNERELREAIDLVSAGAMFLIEGAFAATEFLDEGDTK